MMMLKVVMIHVYNICLIILHIAGKIACYDQVAESILPRAAYQGRGTGGEGIAGKLRLVTCYLLQQLGRDHNSFFTRVKPNFSPIILDFQNPSSRPSGRMQAASVVVQLDQALASSMIVQLEVRQTDDNDDNYIHDDNVIL